MTTQQAVATRSHAGTWMILIGIVGAIAGGITMAVAASRKAKAESSDSFSRALNTYRGLEFDSTGPAVMMGYVGLGVLIFCGLLLLAGIVINAVRR